MASAHMLQSLWFWSRAMWTIPSSEEPFILMCIPFICVTLASAICIFEKGKPACSGVCSVSLSSVAFASRPQCRQQEQGVYSVLITCLIGSVLSSYFMAHCAEGLFYWFLIKSRDSVSAAVPYIFILSFSHCLSTSVMFPADICILQVSRVTFISPEQVRRTNYDKLTRNVAWRHAKGVRSCLFAT